MNAPPSQLTRPQERGRLFLAAALVLIAASILEGFIQSASQGKADISGGIVGNGLLILMLVLAFRGGQLSMKLTKGCAVLFALMVVVLIVIVSVSVFQGIPLPQAPTFRNTGSLIATIFGTIFPIWALFFSTDVKAFVIYQREVAHQRQLQKIKRK